MKESLAAFAPTLVSWLSVLTVIGQIIIALLIAALLVQPKGKLIAWFTKNSMVLMLIVALAATLGSLFFSDIAGWTPCKKCWLQRIFMYPQVILLGMALWKKDPKVAPYILALSIIGLFIAVSHYGEQVAFAMNPPETVVPCDDTGVSCARTPFFHFGYITIPMMAATAFVLNGLGSVLLLRRK